MASRLGLGGRVKPETSSARKAAVQAVAVFGMGELPSGSLAVI